MKRIIKSHSITGFLILLIWSFLMGQSSNAQTMHFKALRSEGLVDASNGKYALARNELVLWLKENPNLNDSLVNFTLADCFWKNKDYSKAFDLYKKLYSMNKNSLPILSTIRFSDLYAMNGDYKMAHSLLEGIMDLDAKAKGFHNIIPFLKDSLNCSLYFLNINSEEGEYLPSSSEGRLFLTTDGTDELKRNTLDLWTGKNYSKLRFIDTANLGYISIDTDFVRKRGSFTRYDSLLNNKSGLKFLALGHEEADNKLRNRVSFAILNTGRSKVNNTLTNFVINSKDTYLNRGNISFSYDDSIQRRCYFMANKVEKLPLKGSKMRDTVILPLFLYTGIVEGDKMDEITPMKIIGFNGEVLHTTVSSDGHILVFSGKLFPGKDYDLFYAERKSIDSWVFVNRFGNNINTIGNEVFPMLQPNGDLYFSSDGLGGLGALDIYKIPYYSNGVVNVLNSIPQNLGYPINSAFDDYAVSVTKVTNHKTLDKNSEIEEGYFSTNRYGSDDIYRFVAESSIYYVIHGKIISRENGVEKGGLANATLHLHIFGDRGDLKSDSLVLSDNEGGYVFAIPRGTFFELNAEKSGWKGDSTRLKFTASKMDQSTDTINLPAIYLDKINDLNIKDTINLEHRGVLTKQFIVHHIFDKPTLVSSDLKVIDSVVTWASEHKDIALALILSATDCYGSDMYNLSLSKRRADYVLGLLRSKGIKQIINLKWIGKSDKYEPCLINKTKIQQQPNRYSTITISYNNKD
jgi:outer membrane protein OmpA-like peptidoglycan-associated protein/tetratricopeptide (TPR) repeat protein